MLNIRLKLIHTVTHLIQQLYEAHYSLAPKLMLPIPTFPGSGGVDTCVELVLTLASALPCSLPESCSVSSGTEDITCPF